MAVCGVCGKRISLLQSSLQLLDGEICCDCILERGFTLVKLDNKYRGELKNMCCNQFDEWTKKQKSLEESTKALKKERANKFNSTSTSFEELKIDENNKIIYISGDYYDFNQIINYELVEDNSTIMKGGLGRALVGDILFGAPGALLGAMTRKSRDVCSSLQIVIEIKDQIAKVKTINLINDELRRDSREYELRIKKARQMMCMLDIVNNHKENNKDEEKCVISVADEIRKFKELLDDGIITSEEFEAKKKQLLNL